MMYFTIEHEMTAMDLIEYLLGYTDNKSQAILELAQEYQLEENILDVLDTNIGENVDPYECIQDIEENTQDYINCLLDNVDENYREDLEEDLQDL